MRLSRRHEGGIDPDVQLLVADPEPRAAARSQRLRLLQLPQPEQVAEEAAGLVLAPGRRRQLHVVDPLEHRGEG